MTIFSGLSHRNLVIHLDPRQEAFDSRNARSELLGLALMLERQVGVALAEVLACAWRLPSSRLWKPR